MRKRNSLLLSCLLALCTAAFSQAGSPGAAAIIPRPKEMVSGTGSFTLSAETKIVAGASPSLQEDISWFNDYLARHYHTRLKVVATAPESNYILFEEAKQTIAGEEGYELSVEQKKIRITAKAGGAGNFYALQSLLQLLPPESNKPLLVSCVQIKDAPRFQWRGMHLDVCRHFFPASFVKRYIDLIALYKMNTFHWHLTDDQGWRIEIKRYPELTRTGARRKGTMVGRYSNQEYDSIPYSGFYTQEEIKDVVAYAAKRHITVVPEIEMPGHAVAAIASYPWLSCTGKQLEVERGWGVFEDVYCTKDSVFHFLENVLDEVIPLFPGKYIHIGGDESPKVRWKSCPVCQSVIRREKLKDEHELQSYFIKRIESYVSSKGRRIIGWDEILEGGLAPNAAVMSWQGQDGGIAAAKEKHPVVMSPVSHCYFDYYQASPASEPLAIGGYIPLEKVYAFEPVPEVLKPEEQAYVMGAQGNLWTEYVLNEKHVEHMVLPRMAALAEVLWTPKDQRNETDFLVRIQKHFQLLDLLGYTYAKSLYRIAAKISPSDKAGSLSLELKANAMLGEIRYTTDGTEPGPDATLYKQAIPINKDLTVKSALFKNREMKGGVMSGSYHINKATNASVSFKEAPHKSYSTGGAFTLVNGETASSPRINEQWLGWNGNDMEAVIKLEREESVREVEAGFLHEELSWIYFPERVDVLASSDGISYYSLGKADIDLTNGKRFVKLRTDARSVRYIKIIAKNRGKIPGGRPGAGENAWLFCDEIIIR